MRVRRIAYGVIGLVLFAGAVAVSFRLSPWPAVLLMRFAFDTDAARRNEALAPLVPTEILAVTDQRYGDGPRALLDVFQPVSAARESKRLPLIVWIHGGAFVAGNKSDVASYLRILAAEGFVAVGVGYDIAPEARYPTPVLQANEALAWVLANAERFPLDGERIVLAGDSAGAQIAAQLASGIADPAYARKIGFEPAVEGNRIKAIILNCGVFDAASMNLQGPLGGFLRTVLWSYFGVRDPVGNADIEEFSVIGRASGAFPPAFITVGNADPLAPQSERLADALARAGLSVERLFYPPEHRPPLQHEYQFDLNSEDGKAAFRQMTAFIRERVAE